MTTTTTTSRCRGLLPLYRRPCRRSPPLPSSFTSSSILLLLFLPAALLPPYPRRPSVPSSNANFLRLFFLPYIIPRFLALCQSRAPCQRSGDELRLRFRPVTGSRHHASIRSTPASGHQRVPIRYPLSVPSAPEAALRLPAVSQNHRVRYPPRSGWLSEWGRLKGGCPGCSVVAAGAL
jgi:hypothetical protein